MPTGCRLTTIRGTREKLSKTSWVWRLGKRFFGTKKYDSFFGLFLASTSTRRETDADDVYDPTW
jgi:hypothetical protein